MFLKGLGHRVSLVARQQQELEAAPFVSYPK